MKGVTGTEGSVNPKFALKKKDFSILVAQAELFNCEVLCQLLKQQGYNVVGKAVEMEDTLQQIRVKRPECVILESEISGQQSVDALRQAQDDNKRTKFILYTSKPDMRLMATALQMGFFGFLYAKDGLEELYKCFQTIDNGGYYYSPGFLTLLKNYGMNILTEDKKQQLNKLSKREKEILRLVSDGHTGGEIADRLSISYRTLANHKTNIAQKLDLESCRHLTRYGVGVRDYLQ
ncbi:helix-turn-helix transcriptional regulator [Tellurirhabdus bombi]|uniref:helix-turn-helix transcriptional regulator n=1 Tax=Tellurirhabdus bombi TaxID=2907205 RepID=UPI001F26568A|nr:response regulator transcription factor [Tellurirhabdus bombi]